MDLRVTKEYSEDVIKSKGGILADEMGLKSEAENFFSEKNIFTCVLLFAQKRGILVSGRDVKALLSAPLEQVLTKALWVGCVSPRKRWDGLLEKLDKHGTIETIQMATDCT